MEAKKQNQDPEKTIHIEKDDDNDFTRNKPLVIDPSKPDPTSPPKPLIEPDEEDEEDEAKVA
jgi:hypothetical protein